MKRVFVWALLVVLALGSASGAVAEWSPNQGASPELVQDANAQKNPSRGHVKGRDAWEYAHEQEGYTEIVRSGVTLQVAWDFDWPPVEPDVLTGTYLYNGQGTGSLVVFWWGVRNGEGSETLLTGIASGSSGSYRWESTEYPAFFGVRLLDGNGETVAETVEYFPEGPGGPQ